MEEQVKKEVTAGTVTSKKEINQEFAKMTLRQIQLIIQLLKVKNVDSINPLALKEIRENVVLVNMNN